MNDPGVRHPKGVTCEVEWATTPSDWDLSKGIEATEVKLKVLIQPELKLPKARWESPCDSYSPGWAGCMHEVSRQPTVVGSLTHGGGGLFSEVRVGW